MGSAPGPAPIHQSSSNRRAPSTRSSSAREEPSQITEHFFRHEYGRLVASLCRNAGFHRIEAAEDAAQWALAKALSSWPLAGLPSDPAGWLFRVAHNALRADLRQQALRRRRLLEKTDAVDLSHGGQVSSDPAALDLPATPPPSNDVDGDLLLMLTACCNPGIAPDAQVMLALKTLCGFSIDEISQRLFRSRASVYKRLSRARADLRRFALAGEGLVLPTISGALPAVRRILYLLFTEGHLSCRATAVIRQELCDEALRLATVLARHPQGAEPETYALLALMHLQTARVPARRNTAGRLLMLEEQDRLLWDATHIRSGLAWLAESANGATFSRYHAEAGIAAEHCLAPSFSKTRWDRVVACYQLLESVAPSPLHRLNRALAVGEWRGAAAGLELLANFNPPAWLTESYQWSAALADLHSRNGNPAAASRFRHVALQTAPSSEIRQLLSRRFTRAVP